MNARETLIAAVEALEKMGFVIIPRSELEAKDKEIAKLRKALEPFALVAEHDISEDEADSDAFRPMPKPFNHAPRITVGHLRAARRALEGGE